ncbi:MAG: prepilin-type N-terminal cleavage/methylation domain-containing protein [Deltaproteobacteria bacterium]|nr:prepilin-type N-terminal cleavage/methylation domain-containing protein [Deltaproteobacteria bacterium]
MPGRKELHFLERIPVVLAAEGYCDNHPEPVCACRRSERGCSNRGKSGFTLIEIAIVIAIVGILATIAVPDYLSYLEKKKEATAISDINFIASQLKGYRMEGVLPANLNQIQFGNALPLIDPWGKPYKYLPLYGYPANQSNARRDHNLHPINSDFDLYSMGPDGMSQSTLQNAKSRDDIVRANDGVFIGKASTYDP